MNILFVDDQENLRLLYQLGLTQKGHRVFTAGGGHEAVLAVRGQSFDIIIMDLEMPHMDGWEAVQKIRTLPSGKNTSIIIFTSQPLVLSSHQIHQRGISGVLNKPLTPAELLTYVSQIVLH